MTPNGPADEWQAFLVLCDCLSLAPERRDRAALGARIGALGWEQLLSLADRFRMGSALVRAIAVAGLAPQVPPLTLPDGRVSITRELALREVEHMRRRAVLGERLDELALACNAEGIVPIAIKGGRSIRTGAPGWRSLRDLDLLVVDGATPRAQEIAFGLGYREAAKPRPRLFHHHQRELYRADMPGWIELHRRAGVSRVEQFIATAEIVAAVTVDELPGRGRVGVLPPHLHVLQGLVHHHVGHRAVKRGIIHPKGLYEFAAETAALSEADRQLLLARAARHPRLLAVFELWSAAAADLFGMPLAMPLAADAVAWWVRLKARLAAEGLDSMARSGEVDEWRAAISPERMQRADGGDSPARRLFWQLAMPFTFIKRPIPPAMILAGAFRRRMPRERAP